MPKVKNWGEKELNFIQISSKQAAVWDEVRALFPELLREEQVYMHNLEETLTSIENINKQKFISC